MYSDIGTKVKIESGKRVGEIGTITALYDSFRYEVSFSDMKYGIYSHHELIHFNASASTRVKELLSLVEDILKKNKKISVEMCDGSFRVFSEE